MELVQELDNKDCPHCNAARSLELVEGREPYTTDHWCCFQCGSTYNIEDIINVE